MSLRARRNDIGGPAQLPWRVLHYATCLDIRDVDRSILTYHNSDWAFEFARADFALVLTIKREFLHFGTFWIGDIDG